MKDIFSDTKAEAVTKRTGVYLRLLSKADKKIKEIKKAFVTDYENKEKLKNDLIKYERIISYLLRRWDRENKTPANA